VKFRGEHEDPVELLQRLFNSFKSTTAGIGNTATIPKYCTKVVPLQVTCFAREETIKQMAIPFIKAQFAGLSKENSSTTVCPFFVEIVRASLTKDQIIVCSGSSSENGSGTQ
jgi:hypothetical protein